MPMATPDRRDALSTHRTSRRDFLRRGGHAALGLTIASQLGWQIGCGDSGSSGSSDSPSQAAWKELEQLLQGTLLRPSDSGYDGTGLATNLAYRNVRPEGIVLPADAGDLQTAVVWAREHGLPAVPRSGGHSYAGYSSTTGLLIDLSPLEWTEFDLDNGYADIGAGALLGPVDAVASALDVVVPSGRCVPVGIGGLVLGGGLGFNARKFGLTSDNLLSTRVVTANGEIVTCSDVENPDLFWACRGGGGGNFGVHVDFRIRVHPVTSASVYKLTWNIEDAAEAWALVQDVARTAPDEFSLILSASIDNTATPPSRLEAIGQYLGPIADLLDLLAPVLDGPPRASETIEEKTIGDATDFLRQTGAPDAYLTKSAFMDEGLPEAAILKVLDWLERFPSDSRTADFAIFTWGGEINRPTPTETAFVHRSAAFTVEMDSSWPPEASQGVIDASKQWIQDFHRDMTPYFTGAAYQNFIDPTLQGWEQAYYGENLARLVEVKQAVDPDNFFHFAQSIPTSL